MFLSAALAMSSDALMSPTPFLFEGRVFVCAVTRTETGRYRPVVMTGGRHGVTRLPADTETCASVSEALRHAEQQAIRWTHDRMRDMQGSGRGTRLAP